MSEKSKVASLDANIAAYEKVRNEMETHHRGKFVVFYNEDLISVHDTFDSAAQEAIKRFGRGPYLIREVGVENIPLPSSVIFHPLYENATS